MPTYTMPTFTMPTFPASTSADFDLSKVQLPKFTMPTMPKVRHPNEPARSTCRRSTYTRRAEHDRLGDLAHDVAYAGVGLLHSPRVRHGRGIQAKVHDAPPAADAVA